MVQVPGASGPTRTNDICMLESHGTGGFPSAGQQKKKKNLDSVMIGSSHIICPAHIVPVFQYYHYSVGWGRVKTSTALLIIIRVLAHNVHTELLLHQRIQPRYITQMFFYLLILSGS